MEEYFEFYSNEMPKDIYCIDENILGDIYAKSDEVTGLNVYFHLQSWQIYLFEDGKKEECAYVCYLLSYYLFVVLTPPKSMELAMHYAKIAFSLNPNEKYEQWIKEVEKGN